MVDGRQRGRQRASRSVNLRQLDDVAIDELAAEVMERARREFIGDREGSVTETHIRTSVGVPLQGWNLFLAESQAIDGLLLWHAENEATQDRATYRPALPARWLHAPANCVVDFQLDAVWGRGAKRLEVWVRNGDQFEVWKSWRILGPRTSSPVAASVPLRRGEQLGFAVTGDGTIEGARLWYKAVSLGTSGQAMPVTVGPVAFDLLHLQADTLDLNDQDRVAAWDDDSGAGNHVSESDTGRQPLYVDAELGGLPVVRFDGETREDRLSGALGTTSGLPVTVFAVARNTSTSFPNIKELVTVNPPTADTRACEIAAGLDDDTAAWRIHSGQELAGTETDTDWHVFAAVFDGSASLLEVDGQAVAEGDAGSLGFDGDLFVGARFDHGWDGDIAEVGVASVAATAEQREATRQFLADKWGL